MGLQGPPGLMGERGKYIVDVSKYTFTYFYFMDIQHRIVDLYLEFGCHNIHCTNAINQTYVAHSNTTTTKTLRLHIA